MSGEVYTILLTTYECHGMGPAYTVRNLKSIFDQTYRPLQVVVSDHSKNDEVEQAVRSLDPKGVDVTYVRYTEHYGNPCANWTNALKYAKGAYLNYFAMDEYLHHPTAVEEVVTLFRDRPEVKWVACSFVMEPTRTRYTPWWPASILKENRIGGPSGVVVRSDLRHIKLHPDFLWLLDVEWYYRLSREAGPPHISEVVYYHNCHTPYQLTHTVCTEEVRAADERRLEEFYGPKGTHL